MSSESGAVVASTEARRDLEFVLFLLEPECENMLDEALRRNEGVFFGRGVRSQKVSGTKKNRSPRLNPTTIATTLQIRSASFFVSLCCRGGLTKTPISNLSPE